MSNKETIQVANTSKVRINPATEEKQDAISALVTATNALITASNALLTTIDADTSSIATDASTIAGDTTSIDGKISSTVNADRNTNIDGELGLNVNAMAFGRVSDSIVKNLRSDASTESLMTVSYEHHEIHAGTHFFHNDVHDLSINNVLDYRFTTPNTTEWAHMLMSFDTEAETQYILYEGVAITTAGTTAPCFNSNRNRVNTCTIAIDEITNSNLANANSDTNLTGAIILWNGIVGAGKQGGSHERSNEIMLKQNTIYCLRFIASSAGYVNTDFVWYEHSSRNP